MTTLQSCMRAVFGYDIYLGWSLWVLFGILTQNDSCTFRLWPANRHIYWFCSLHGKLWLLPGTNRWQIALPKRFICSCGIVKCNVNSTFFPLWITWPFPFLLENMFWSIVWQLPVWKHLFIAAFLNVMHMARLNFK